MVITLRAYVKIILELSLIEHRFTADTFTPKTLWNSSLGSSRSISRVNFWR
jgi:hypothetical protein